MDTKAKEIIDSVFTRYSSLESYSHWAFEELNYFGKPFLGKPDPWQKNLVRFLFQSPNLFRYDKVYGLDFGSYKERVTSSWFNGKYGYQCYDFDRPNNASGIFAFFKRKNRRVSDCVTQMNNLFYGEFLLPLFFPHLRKSSYFKVWREIFKAEEDGELYRLDVHDRKIWVDRETFEIKKYYFGGGDWHLSASFVDLDLERKIELSNYDPKAATRELLACEALRDFKGEAGRLCS